MSFLIEHTRSFDSKKRSHEIQAVNVRETRQIFGGWFFFLNIYLKGFVAVTEHLVISCRLCAFVCHHYMAHQS
jgi:hypothetical protein